eukprot:3652658-Heterocapsa_arctica.AAC.1
MLHMLARASAGPGLPALKIERPMTCSSPPRSRTSLQSTTGPSSLLSASSLDSMSSLVGLERGW